MKEYSTNEVDINSTWITGKRIYRRVFNPVTFGADITVGDNVIDSSFNTTNIQSITHFEGFGIDPYGALVPIPYHNGNATNVDSWWFMNESGLHVVSQTQVRLFAIIVDYTKM